MKVAHLVGCAALLAAVPVHAAEKPLNHGTRDTDRLGWLVPDFGKVQSGGYAGRIAVGIGYAALSDVINIGVDYGYVPRSEVGREVHSVTTWLGLRPLDFRIGRFRLVPGYLWGGFLFTRGDGYFFTPGDRYPAGYYRPTAMHAIYGVGVELDWLPSRSSPFERHGLFWEARTLGPYFVTYLENQEQVALSDVVVSAVGYRLAW